MRRHVVSVFIGMDFFPLHNQIIEIPVEGLFKTKEEVIGHINKIILGLKLDKFITDVDGISYNVRKIGNYKILGAKESE